MATSIIKNNSFNSFSQGMAANTTTHISLGNYIAALLIVGNPNRTAAQSGVYALTNNNDVIVLKSSNAIVINSVANNEVVITPSVNTTATVFIHRQ